MSVYDHTIKTGDESPAFARTLLDGEGNAVDVTGASVQFIMENLDGTTVVESSAQVVDGQNGEVRYNWSDGDTDTVGTYRAEFEVDYGQGASPETFPNSGYLYVRVTEDLGGTA